VSWDIVLPYTRSAVIGGVFLGLGRALGETMAVAFVIGNSVGFTKSLLEPSTTIAALDRQRLRRSDRDLPLRRCCCSASCCSSSPSSCSRSRA
jgi:ABC-type phosphate transport system permease subunit